MVGGPRSYPRQILVGDQMWDVRFVRKNSFAKLPKELLGQCDPSERVILIRMGQPKSEMLSTFLHEVMHCFEFEGEFTGCPRAYHKFVFDTESWWANFLSDNCQELISLFLTNYEGRQISTSKARPQLGLRPAAKTKTKGGQ